MLSPATRRIGRHAHLARRSTAPRPRPRTPRPRRGLGGTARRGADDPAAVAAQRRRDHAHCVEMVQTRDREGYLCGLLMPSAAREAHFALRAFNAEVAGIKDASQLAGRSQSRGARPAAIASRFEENTAPGAGGDASLATRLRMQWWRDAVADLYADGGEGAAPSADGVVRALDASRQRHPTLRSLGHAVRAHGLTQRFLRRILEAREADLEVTQYRSLRDVAQYGEDVTSSLLYLSLECAGVRDEAADRVASDVGVGLGLLTALRATGFRAARGECAVPADLARKHGVTLDTVWSAGDASTPTDDDAQREEAAAAQEKLRGAAREMADAAAFHLGRARGRQAAVPPEGRACLLPAACGLRYLESLQRCEYDVLHPALGGGDAAAAGPARTRRLGLMFVLGRTWLTGTF